MCTLVYSTCTFSREEDEEQVEAFLRREEGFTLQKSVKLLPHRVEGEGHFAAVFKKEGGREGEARRIARTGNVLAERAFRAFEKETLEGEAEGEIVTLADGRMYLLPEESPDLCGILLLRYGVELGEWDGKLFRPAHALALSAGMRVKKRVELDEEDAVRYLRGEALPAAGSESGYFAATYRGYALGLMKASCGLYKNLLPKGLRMFSKQK